MVWINMLGELWRAAAEQVRLATSCEKLGSELIAEQAQEMQERLKRGSHRAGYKDITGEEWPEMSKEDEVEREGRERGMPRVRFDEQVEDDGLGEQAVGEDYDPTTPEEEVVPVPTHSRRNSTNTIGEPEAEETVRSVPSASGRTTSGRSRSPG